MSSLEPREHKPRRSKKENLEFEISFYEALLKKDPKFIEALIPLAENYTRVGRHEEGLKIDLELSKLLPEDPMVHYNLACSYSLLNQIDASGKALDKAIHLGYHDFEHMEKDPDLALLRSSPVYHLIKKNIPK
jgi:tetratricopeptide (TPR) repeat protein